MKLRMGWMLAFVALLAFLPVGVSLAQGTGRPLVIFTDHYLLGEADRVDGSLVVVAQTITLESGSVITGDAALLGNAITVEGEIRGELTTLGEDVVLADGSHIEGSVFLCADAIHRQHNAHINGSYQPGCEQIGSLLQEVVPVAFDSSRWQWEEGEFSLADWRERMGVTEHVSTVQSLTFGQRMAGMLGVALLAGAFSAMFTLIVPLRLRRVSDAALSAPLTTVGVGLLSLVVAGGVTGLVVLSLVLVITFCLVPFVGLGWVILGVMLLLGWAAISLPFGAWFLARLGVRRVSPVAAATVGALLVAGISGLLALTLWTTPLYILVMLLLASWGLGAVVLTRLGGQIYPAGRPHRPATVRRKRDMDEFPFEA
ncbi:MAG: hypothetical protein JXN59_03650 [Anaerolineae bacterium]|nr:hypothetical protein [Anaerolineae bacterium]